MEEILWVGAPFLFFAFAIAFAVACAKLGGTLMTFEYILGGVVRRASAFFTWCTS